jgi:uroporphyrinogen decarboxylase
MRTLLQRTIIDKEPNLYPIWLMRQAGRYMSEYMAIKNASKGFLDMALTPSKAAEITMQPIKAFDMDAAIIFSDILIIPYALGQELDYTPGPVLGPFDPKIFETEMSQLRQQCEPVYEAIRRTRQQLDPSKSLIGFVGAPWTLYRYMTGNNNPDTMDPFESREHIGHLVKFCVEHLAGQIEAGCDCVQIFDSWAGDLEEDFIIDYCFDPTAQIVAQIKARYPDVGVIAFPRMIGREVKNFTAWCDPYVDCVSLSGDVPVKYLYKHMGTVTIQGGLAPELLLQFDKEKIMRGTLPFLRQMEDMAYVVNLNHGVIKETPVDSVAFLVEIIKRFRKHKGN